MPRGTPPVSTCHLNRILRGPPQVRELKSRMLRGPPPEKAEIDLLGEAMQVATVHSRPPPSSNGVCTHGHVYTRGRCAMRWGGRRHRRVSSPPSWPTRRPVSPSLSLWHATATAGYRLTRSRPSPGAQAFPSNFTALVDTYDTIKSGTRRDLGAISARSRTTWGRGSHQAPHKSHARSSLVVGVRNFLCVARVLHRAGYRPIGIRLDSGDLAYLSKAPRYSPRYAFADRYSPSDAPLWCRLTRRRRVPSSTNSRRAPASTSAS